MPSRTLVTGFGSFMNVKDNPSAEMALAVERPHEVLEVTYDAVESFLRTVDRQSFDTLVMLGVAQSRTHLSIELFARNTYSDAADAGGTTRSGTIAQGAPLLLESSLCKDEILSEILVSDPMVRMSLDAGNYLCNFAYYKALSTLTDKHVGFIHVPPFEKIAFADQMKSLRYLLTAFEVSNG